MLEEYHECPRHTMRESEEYNGDFRRNATKSVGIYESVSEYD